MLDPRVSSVDLVSDVADSLYYKFPPYLQQRLLALQLKQNDPGPASSTSSSTQNTSKTHSRLTPLRWRLSAKLRQITKSMSSLALLRTTVTLSISHNALSARTARSRCADVKSSLHTW